MQATIYSILPFDALIGGIIKFSWKGNQAFKNRCIIKKNETNETVYDKTIESFKYEHNIDLSVATLVNGEKYSVFITVFDKDNVESDLQALGESLFCLKTPSFTFTNITDGQVISASSYTFSLAYSQENNELLDSWSISLYTTAHTVLATSGTKYNTDDISHTFSGFSNKNAYSVRAVGKTVNGLDVDTGYINISVTYSIRDVFSLLEPTNIAEQGAIQIRSNIVSSEGHPEKDVTFIGGNAVDLRDNVLRYTEGYEFKGDFSFVQVFYNIQFNEEVLTMTAQDPTALTLSVIYRIGNFETSTRRACYELNIKSYNSKMVLYSNIIDLPADDDKIGLCIYRSNGYYNIEIRNLGKVVV